MTKLIVKVLALLTVCYAPLLIAANDSYAIIIDAGSTGSRLHLFQYHAGLKLPVITDIFSESNKMGLSTFASHPDDAGASFKQLFDDAMQTLQKNNIDPKTVPVSLLATAGMRLLPDCTQQAIYSNVKNYLNSSYPQLPIQKIETISGKMEGLYGWLDINYLSGNFKTGKTLGSIDMGGASTQIAFETQDTTRSSDETTLKIGLKHYNIFSKSFLGLGEDQALASIDKTPDMNTCYSIQYPLSGGGTGSFNYPTCSALYTDLIQDNHVSQQILPTAQQQFIAYSGAYYAYSFFGVDQTPDQSTVEKRLQSVCSEDWDELQKDYPTTPTKYLATYCANMIYLDDLFYNTYQLQGSQLKIAAQINQINIDWPLGALLYSLVSNDNQE